LNRIVQLHTAQETLVVVSHNFPILGIICRITGTHLNNYRTYHLDPCGVTRLNHHGGDHWGVTCINNQEYTAETPLAR
jgi:broad specificity phosphatase PhoE